MVTVTLGADVLANVVLGVHEEGYHRISSAAYLDATLLSELKHFQESYFRLLPDSEGGNRFRSYGRLVMIGSECFETSTKEYVQKVDYNYADGGKVRIFSPLERRVVRSAILRRLVEVDADIVRKSGIVSFDGPVRIGVHQVRYQPVAGEISCSSPPGPHRDDEPVVFVHHINESNNVTGGENTLGKSVHYPEFVVKLDHPLDTLCLTQKHFHAVVPHGLRSGTIGYRDILLVTFQGETESPEVHKRLFVVRH